MVLLDKLVSYSLVSAIINDTTSALAVVNDKSGTSANLSYIIGGLIVVIIVIVANTLFNKK